MRRLLILLAAPLVAAGVGLAVTGYVILIMLRDVLDWSADWD